MCRGDHRGRGRSTLAAAATLQVPPKPQLISQVQCRIWPLMGMLLEVEDLAVGLEGIPLFVT